MELRRRRIVVAPDIEVADKSLPRLTNVVGVADNLTIHPQRIAVKRTHLQKAPQKRCRRPEIPAKTLFPYFDLLVEQRIEIGNSQLWQLDGFKKRGFGQRRHSDLNYTCTGADPACAKTPAHWRKRPIFRAASRVRSSLSIRLNRTKPSPIGPNPIPGETATRASRIICFANSSEPISINASGMRAHTNIEAFGGSMAHPASRKLSISTSRLPCEIRAISPGASWQFVSAVTAA